MCATHVLATIVYTLQTVVRLNDAETEADAEPLTTLGATPYTDTTANTGRVSSTTTYTLARPRALRMRTHSFALHVMVVASELVGQAVVIAPRVHAKGWPGVQGLGMGEGLGRCVQWGPANNHYT